MGCDFRWSATEEDVYRQRKCGWFLESLFDADEKGISRYFGPSWKCQTFDGYYTGYFHNFWHAEKKAEFKTIQLIGTTIYEGDISEWGVYWMCWAGRQYSFVFDNTSYETPKLITIEFISDLSKPKYELVRKHFYDAEEKDPNALKAIYSDRGYDRLTSSEGWLARLLYSIKTQFLPDLRMSDDYQICKEISEANSPIPSEFSESICKPALAKKWGFDFLDVSNKTNCQ